MDDVDNEFIHLTNNAIQKHATTYGQFEHGNQISFDEFEKYLTLMGAKVSLRPHVREDQLNYCSWSTR